MITFPLSLAVLAFSGFEDILYFWLDGRALPENLFWLNNNPLIFLKPVTSTRLVISALTWLLVVTLLEFVGNYMDRRYAITIPRLTLRRVKNLRFAIWLLLIWLARSRRRIRAQ